MPSVGVIEILFVSTKRLNELRGLGSLTIVWSNTHHVVRHTFYVGKFMDGLNILIFKVYLFVVSLRKIKDAPIYYLLFGERIIQCKHMHRN